MDRTYPSRPIVGVGAVIFDRDGRVILVKRAHEPLKGRWSLPGGAVELGEPVRAAILREVREETGLEVSVGDVIDVVDHVAADEAGAVRHHFVIIDYVCRVESGEVAAGGDADAAVAVTLDRLDEYALTDRARGIILRAAQMVGSTS
jgi:8-oxo-dGTP diphosphatase